jgi:hypothetical protein
MRTASACHVKALLSARSPTLGACPESVPKKKGPRWGGGAKWVVMQRGRRVRPARKSRGPSQKESPDRAGAFKVGHMKEV